jgi:hypothetical protein
MARFLSGFVQWIDDQIPAYRNEHLLAAQFAALSGVLGCLPYEVAVPSSGVIKISFEHRLGRGNSLAACCSVVNAQAQIRSGVMPIIASLGWRLTRSTSR